MDVITLKPAVINGGVWQAGKVLRVPDDLVKHLECNEVAERMDYEYNPADWQWQHNREKVRDVLVFTPVKRLEEETVRAVLGLEWDGAISHLFQRDNPSGIGLQDHLHQYQRGREAFLAGRYDAMLVIESDIIPPADALKKLAALEADCAYGVYRFRVSNVINIFEKYPGASWNMGESLSCWKAKLRYAKRLGRIACSGAGLGCVLIRRRVLEAIPFRVEQSAHCDTWFNIDVLRAGYSQAADMSVICGHKTEAGEVLCPTL